MVQTVNFYQQPPMMAEGLALGQEEERLRQALLELAQKRTPGLLDSGRFKSINLEGLADVLRGDRLKGDLEVTQKKKADFSGKYLEEVARRLRAYQTEESGQSNPPLTPVDDEGNPNLPIKTKGNAEAYRNYLNDPFPEVRAAAQGGEKRTQEAAKLRAELFKLAATKASLPSIQQGIAQGQDPSVLQEPQELQFWEGGVFDKKTGVPIAKTTQVPTPGGREGEMSNLHPSGRMDNLDKRTSVSVSTGDKAGAGMLVNRLPELKKAGDKLVSSYRATETAMQALQEGAKTGFGADFFEKAKSLTSYVTGLNFDSASNFGTLAAVLAKSTIDELGGLGASVSNTDRDFMAAATGGTSNTPQALERILAIRAGAMQRKLYNYQNELKSAAAGAESEDMQNRLVQAHQIEMPKTGFNFTSIEAEASYLANLTNIPYFKALEEVKKMRKEQPGNVPGVKPMSVQDAMNWKPRQ